MTARRTIVVIAKAPVPGRVKTRLCPPLSERQAAALAEAALLDTLATVRRVPSTRRVLALDGEPPAWVPDGVEVVPQCVGGLDRRIASAMSIGGAHPTLLVGMDTPQLDAADLTAAFDVLEYGVDAVIGPASDGGYWLLGMRAPDPRAVLGVPMSVAVTGRVQRDRLEELGLTTATVRELRDVDRYEDALAAAREAPSSRFAGVLAVMEHAMASTR